VHHDAQCLAVVCHWGVINRLMGEGVANGAVLPTNWWVEGQYLYREKSGEHEWLPPHTRERLQHAC
jgi:hypothetical protein